MDHPAGPKMNPRLQQQLQNFKTRVGANPSVEDNGRFLHFHGPIGGFNEWIACTYNLQVLRDISAENIKLRKEISDLMRNYMTMILVRCNVLSPRDCMSYPVGSQTSWWTWLLSVMHPKFQGSTTATPPSNNPGMMPGNFPGYGSAPAAGAPACAGNQAAFLAWMASMMNNNADAQNPTSSYWPGFPSMNQ